MKIYIRNQLILVIILLLSILNTHAQSSWLCIQCLPAEVITSDNIVNLKRQLVGDSVALDLSFSTNSQQLVIIDSPSASNISNTENLPDSVEIWMRNDIAPYSLWDISMTLEPFSTYLDVQMVEGVETNPSVVAVTPSTIHMWHADNSQVASIYTTERMVTQIHHLPNTNQIITLDETQQLHHYRLEREQIIEIPTFDNDLLVDDIIVSPNGEYLLLIYNDEIFVFDMLTNSIISTEISVDGIFGTVFKPQDENLFFTVSTNFITQWHWDIDNLTLRQLQQTSIPITYEDEIHHIAINSDGSLLVFAINGDNLMVWDTVTNNEIFVDALEMFEQTSDNLAIYEIAFSPDGLYLVIAKNGGFVSHIIP